MVLRGSPPRPPAVLVSVSEVSFSSQPCGKVAMPSIHESSEDRHYSCQLTPDPDKLKGPNLFRPALDLCTKPSSIYQRSKKNLLVQKKCYVATVTYSIS